MERAKEDADPRVRREAIRRIELPRALLELVETARDDEERALARGRAESLLTTIAADKRDLAESRRALALLEPPLRVADVAVRAHFRELRDEALERLLAMTANGSTRDPALARVAGRARDPEARRRALAAVTSEDALVQVASAPGALEAGQAAVRRLDDPDRLLAVAQGNAAPQVRRLARRRAEARLPADHPYRVEERTRQVLALVGDANGTDLPSAEALAAEGPVSEAAEALLRQRREAAAAARESRAPSRRLEVERPAVAAPVAPRPPEFPEADALLEELEAGTDSLLLDRIAAIERDARRALEGKRGAGPWFERLRTAAGKARDAARERKRRKVVAYEFGELVDRAEALVKAFESEDRNGPPPSGRELAHVESRFASAPEELRNSVDGERIQQAAARARELAAAAKASRESRVAAARERIEALEKRFESLAEADPLSLDEAEGALRDLAAARADGGFWKRVAPDRRARLDRRRSALLPRVREARELLDWQRWSNLGSQAELIESAEALVEVEDLARVDRELRTLENSWRAVRKAHPERGQELWNRWTEARERLLERVAPLRAQAAKDLEGKLAALEKLAETAEEIAAAGDFARVGEMRDLMPAFRENAKGCGKRSEPVYRRFRKANDEFFAGWKASRKEREAGFAEAIAARETLIGAAEALAAKANPSEVRDAVRDLMARWKASAQVPRKHVEPMWNRFRDACDGARDRPPPPEPLEDADRDALASFEEAVAALGGLPASDRAAAGVEIWPAYRRVLGLESPDAGAARDRLLTLLGEAFDEAAETFDGGPLDQARLEAKLAEIGDSLETLAPVRKFGRDGNGVRAMADHLKRALAEGGAHDRDATAREAADKATRLLRRARAAGPALAPSARDALDILRKRVEEIVARAPKPEPERPPPRRRRFSGRRPRAG